MNELAIKVNYESDKPTVSGRELHEKLGIRAAYKDWFRVCANMVLQKAKTFAHFLSGSTGGRPETEHQLTI